MKMTVNECDYAMFEASIPSKRHWTTRLQQGARNSRDRQVNGQPRLDMRPRKFTSLLGIWLCRRGVRAIRFTCRDTYTHCMPLWFWIHPLSDTCNSLHKTKVYTATSSLKSCNIDIEDGGRPIREEENRLTIFSGFVQGARDTPSTN